MGKDVSDPREGMGSVRWWFSFVVVVVVVGV